ncbi:MAG TPA: diguanylate cyclase [Vicinamibacteria bacterium]|nr:diguanylate cyclase [Vicinamibacteria bacterium]
MVLRPGAVLSLLLAAGATPALAGDPASIAESGRSAIKIYSDQDGLPQNSIEAVSFDRQGYLWLGTQDGAVRYNGREWVSLSMPRPTVANWVSSILLDQDGSLWFGTRGDGVHRYRDGRFHSFGVDEGFPDPQVLALQQTLERGRPVVWAGTADHGLIRIAEDKVEQVEAPADTPFVRVNALATAGGEEGAPGLWVGTERGLLHLSGRSWTAWDRRDFGLPSDHVLSVLETEAPGGSRALWVGTEHGLAVREHGTWRVVPLSNGMKNDYVYRLAATRTLAGEPVVWMGTEGGLSRLEAGRWRFWNMARGLPSNVIRTLTPVASANGPTTLWIGSFGGLVRLTEGKWTSYTHNTGLAENAVFSIQEFAPDDMWFGTLGGGLSRLRDGRWSQVSRYRERPIPAVMSLLKARGPQGGAELWVGTRGSGLLRFDGGSWSEILPLEALPDTWIYALLETGSAERGLTRWVGTRKGLLRLQGRERRVYTKDSGLPHDHVVALLASHDAQGRPTLWIGTRGGGVACLDLESGRFSTYDPQHSVGGLRVGSLLETSGPGSRRFLWISSNGAGVYRLDLADPAAGFVNFSESSLPALPSDLIYQMREDAAGRLYFFTRRGVARFTPRQPDATNPAEYAVFTYTSGDGLPSNGCTQGSSFVDHLGRLWTGTVAGAAMFDPAEEREDRLGKPLYLESATRVGSGRALSPGAVLEYGENHLVFRYALLSYHREGDTRYQVQLAGLDAAPSDWIADGRKEYTTLPPGTYLFRVWGRDYAGNQSGPVELAFRIRPAFWQTWWAFLAYALLAAAGVALVFRLRLHHLKARAAQLEARVAERTAELEAANRALEEQSLTDPLTGVRNRRFVAATLPLDVAQVVRTYRERLALHKRDGDANLDLVFLLVDMDHFKSVNDGFGHLGGDSVLQQVVERLKAAVRQTDTVVRWGGEEFLVLARQSNRREAPAVAERIRATMAERSFEPLAGERVTCTCSVGFAAFPFLPGAPEVVPWEQVVHLADHALYAAKRGGRDAWVGLEAASDVDPARLGESPFLRIPELLSQGLLEVRSSLPAGSALDWGSSPSRR